jgi:hypothetical protein
MKKINYALSGLLLMAALFAGCSNDDLTENVQQGRLVSVLSDRNATSSRTSYEYETTGGLAISWLTSDELSVSCLSGGATHTEKFSQHGTITADGKTTSFHNVNSILTDGTVYAHYPYAADLNYDLSSQTGTLAKLGDYDVMSASGTLANSTISKLSFASDVAVLLLPKNLSVLENDAEASETLTLSFSGNGIGNGITYALSGSSETKTVVHGAVSVNAALSAGKLSNDIYLAFVPTANGTCFLTAVKGGVTYVRSFTVSGLVAGKVYPVKSGTYLKAAETVTASLNVAPGATKAYDTALSSISSLTFTAVPDGWTAKQNGTSVDITAPSAPTDKNTTGIISFIATASDGSFKCYQITVGAYTLRVLTFEDADYKGDGNYLGKKDWSSLIDSPQYGGKLLYGDSGYGPTDYNWYDQNNTELASVFPTNYGTTCYWGGGHALSNYVETTLTNGDYSRQLAVPMKDATTGFGGHNGSKNFCVHFGYMDGSAYNQTTALPFFYFKDNKARVIESMYVGPTTYLLNVETNGNGLSAPASDKDYIYITAVGFDASGTKTGEVKMYLAYKGGFVKNWTKWDLSSLGKVVKVMFNVGGSNDNGYGFSQPAYFAYDDVAVRF